MTKVLLAEHEPVETASLAPSGGSIISLPDPGDSRTPPGHLLHLAYRVEQLRLGVLELGDGQLLRGQPALLLLQPVHPVNCLAQEVPPGWEEKGSLDTIILVTPSVVTTPCCPCLASRIMPGKAIRSLAWPSPERPQEKMLSSRRRWRRQRCGRQASVTWWCRDEDTGGQSGACSGASSGTYSLSPSLSVPHPLV